MPPSLKIKSIKKLQNNPIALKPTWTEPNWVKIIVK